MLPIVTAPLERIGNHRNVTLGRGMRRVQSPDQRRERATNPEWHHKPTSRTRADCIRRARVLDP